MIKLKMKRFTKLERQKMAFALRRVVEGGVVTEDERPLIQKLSHSLDRPTPLHACPQCWLLRVIRGEE